MWAVCRISDSTDMAEVFNAKDSCRLEYLLYS